jgi:hypothetical protein
LSPWGLRTSSPSPAVWSLHPTRQGPAVRPADLASPRGGRPGFDDHRPDFGGTGSYDRETYEDGRRLGQFDRSRGLSNDYRRHFGRYPMRYEDSFRRGYQNGWYLALKIH